MTQFTQFLHLFTWESQILEKNESQYYKTYEKWNFPNAFVADNGKHIRIICPKYAGSKFYKYKGVYSIVLIAFVDYNYRFLMVEIGCQGGISDWGLFRNLDINFALKQNKLNFPAPIPLLENDDPFWQWFNNEQRFPLVSAGDNCFPLSQNCMKSYSTKHLLEEMCIFNYKLSWFRKVSKNTFGIWTNTFKLFQLVPC